MPEEERIRINNNKSIDIKAHLYSVYGLMIANH